MFMYEEELRCIKDALGEASTDIDFRPATKEDIEYLRGLLYPESVIAFYEQAEPSRWVEIDSVILNTVADIWGENENTLPGDRILPVGYLNIATALSGDTFCIDLTSVEEGEEPPVVMVSREITEYQSDEEVMAYTARVADSFRDFLRKFADGALPQDFRKLKAA